MSAYFNLYVSDNKLCTDLQQALPVRRYPAVSQAEAWFCCLHACGRQNMRHVFLTTNITMTASYTSGHHTQLDLYIALDVSQPSACTTKHWLQTSLLLSKLAVCQISERTALPSDTDVGYKSVQLLNGYSNLLVDIWSRYGIELAMEHAGHTKFRGNSLTGCDV